MVLKIKYRDTTDWWGEKLNKYSRFILDIGVPIYFGKFRRNRMQLPVNDEKVISIIKKKFKNIKYDEDSIEYNNLL